MKIEVNFKSLALGTYVVLSAVFILYVFAAEFRNVLLERARQAGQADAVKAVIAKATDGKCEAFNLFADDKKVDLINVECLKKGGDGAGASVPMPMPEAKSSATAPTADSAKK